MLGLVLGPGDVLGVGLVVLGVSVPMPPAAPELMPEELPPDSAGMDEEPELEGMLDELPPDELPLDEPPFSEGIVELPLELLPDVPLVPPELPLVPLPEPPPVMPEHATISIAQATDIIHLIIDHSR